MRLLPGHPASDTDPGLLFQMELQFFIDFLMRPGSDQKAKMRQPFPKY